VGTHIAFKNEDLDGQFVRSMTAAYYGAADLGEIYATARTIETTKAHDWWTQWVTRAHQVKADAESSLARGHDISARDGYLRAGEYYRQAFYFLRSNLDDPNLQKGYRKHRLTFAKAAPLLGCEAEEVSVPYTESRTDHTIHGWMWRPSGSNGRRPTLVMPCGYDSTAEAGWSYAPAALERGYNVLSIEGPGQGKSLYEDRLWFRPDYETVFTQIVDWLVTRSDVDTERIGLVGRSFGGYLAPRAATAEHRIAALVCDPAQPDMGAKIPSGFAGRVAAPAMTAASVLSEQRQEFFGSRMAAHGVDTIADYFAELKKFTMLATAGDIDCPTFIVESTGDPVGGGGQTLFDALTVENKVLCSPGAETGLAGHCGGLGQRVWERLVYDWLDEVLTPRA
jgi:pimeloyl-ACP methyl ester carboxylesterase